LKKVVGERKGESVPSGNVVEVTARPPEERAAVSASVSHQTTRTLRTERLQFTSVTIECAGLVFFVALQFLFLADGDRKIEWLLHQSIELPSAARANHDCPGRAVILGS
jgi:hypothetical protein